MGFSRFQLTPALFQAITKMGFAEPTPIQAQAIPPALEGRDVRACAQTGTGKTCAFVIPILEQLMRHPPKQKPSVLVLTPTRELAAQIITVVHELVKGTRIRTALILGGAGYGQQLNQLRAGADIVVATPGRLMDLMNRRSISLRDVRMMVLDEADRMLDMGFLPDVKRILQEMPEQRQTMLFSATFGAEIKNLTNQFLKNPAVVDLSPSSTATSANVTQMAYPVPQDQKKALVQALLELNNMTSALIFTRTKHGADRLQKFLQGLDRKAAVIHSDRTQNQRQQALQGFKDRRYQILVATDIAARGIDVKDISHVINYDVPRHPEDYVHRIGRTGRAQSIGEAFTLVAPDEENLLRRIEHFIKKPIPRGVVPDFPYLKKPKVFPTKTASPQAPSRPSTPAQPARSHQHEHKRPSLRPDRPSHQADARHSPSRPKRFDRPARPSSPPNDRKPSPYPYQSETKRHWSDETRGKDERSQRGSPSSEKEAKRPWWQFGRKR